MKAISFTGARTWWGSPLLRLAPAPKEHAERVFVSGADRKSPGAAVLLFYEPSSPHASGRSYSETLAAGGVALQVVFNDGTRIDDGAFWSKHEGVIVTPTTVRGFPAELIEIRRPDKGILWRRLAWNEPADGGVANWSLATHLDAWSDSDARRLVDLLTSG